MMETSKPENKELVKSRQHSSWLSDRPTDELDLTSKEYKELPLVEDKLEPLTAEKESVPESVTLPEFESPEILIRSKAENKSGISFKLSNEQPVEHKNTEEEPGPPPGTIINYKMTDNNEMVLTDRDIIIKAKQTLKDMYDDKLSEQNVEIFKQAMQIFEIDSANLKKCPEKYDIEINVREYRFKEGKDGLMTREKDIKTGVVVSEFDDERFEMIKSLAIDSNYKSKLNSGTVISGTQQLKNRIENKKSTDEWDTPYILELRAIANKYTVEQFDEMICSICTTFKSFREGLEKNSIEVSEWEKLKNDFAYELTVILFNKACLERPFVTFYAKIFDNIIFKRKMTVAQCELLDSFFNVKDSEMVISRLYKEYVRDEIVYGKCTQEDYKVKENEDELTKQMKEYNARLHFKGCCRFMAHLFACNPGFIEAASMTKIIIALIEEELMEYPNDRRIKEAIEKQISEVQKEGETENEEAVIANIIKMMCDRTSPTKDTCIVEAIENYALVSIHFTELQKEDKIPQPVEFELTVIERYFMHLRENPSIGGSLVAFKAKNLVMSKNSKHKSKENTITFVIFPCNEDFDQIKNIWQSEGLLQVVEQLYQTSSPTELAEKLKEDLSIIVKFINVCFAQGYGMRLVKDKYELVEICSTTTANAVLDVILFQAVEKLTVKDDQVILDYVISSLIEQECQIYKCVQYLSDERIERKNIIRFIEIIINGTVLKAYLQVLDQYFDDEMIEEESFNQLEKHFEKRHYDELYSVLDVYQLMREDHYSYFDEPDFAERKSYFMKCCTTRFEDNALFLLRRIFVGREEDNEKVNSELKQGFETVTEATGSKALEFFTESFESADFPLGMYIFEVIGFDNLPDKPRAWFLRERVALRQHMNKVNANEPSELSRFSSSLCPSIAWFMLETCYELTSGEESPATSMLTILQELVQIKSFDRTTANELIRTSNIKRVEGSYGQYELPQLK